MFIDFYKNKKQNNKKNLQHNDYNLSSPCSLKDAFKFYLKGFLHSLKCHYCELYSHILLVLIHVFYFWHKHSWYILISMHCLILFTNVLFRKYASMFTCFLLWNHVFLSLYKVLKYFYSLFLAFYWIGQLFFVLLFLLMVETSISLFLVITSTFKLLLYEWVKSLSHVWLFATPWSVAYQAPPSMGFSRQEYWSGLPFPSPGDLPNPGVEPRFPTL